MMVFTDSHIFVSNFISTKKKLFQTNFISTKKTFSNKLYSYLKKNFFKQTLYLQKKTFSNKLYSYLKKNFFKQTLYLQKKLFQTNFISTKKKNSDKIYIYKKKLFQEEKVEPVPKCRLLSVGDKVSVEVVAFENRGAVVRTADGKVKGFVRENHLTDSLMANPERKIPVGSVREAKVIEITEKLWDEGTTSYSYYFTFKTRFLESKIPLLKEYSEDKVGSLAIGVITKVSHSCLYIVFGQNVRGEIS